MFVLHLTRVFSSFIPLNEADNENNQDEESDGTHESNEPSLSGDVHLSACHSWPEENHKNNIIFMTGILFKVFSMTRKKYSQINAERVARYFDMHNSY